MSRSTGVYKFEEVWDDMEKYGVDLVVSRVITGILGDLLDEGKFDVN